MLTERNNTPEDLEALSSTEILQKLHELKVYQIELEMQNAHMRQTLAELEALQNRYFDLYDKAPVAYCTVCEKGLILDFNLKASQLLGQTRGALIGQKLSRFIFTEDQDRYYLLHRQLLGSAGPQECEMRMVQMNGTVFWAHLSASLAQDESGAPVCRMVLSDQTERKQTEEKYRSLVENTSDCIWEIDKYGRYTYLNPAFQSLTGYSPTEFLGKTPADLLPEDQDMHVREHMMAARTAPQPFSWLETVIRRRDGRLVTIEAGGIPLFNLDGQFSGMRGITRDATERKVMEGKLRNSEEQYRMLFDNAADAIVIVGMEANILSANEQACRQYGYEKEEFLQLKVHDLDTPEEAAHIPERLALLTREGKSVFETVHRDVKGNTFPVEVKAIKISFNGKPCLMSICRDISQRKEAEKFLRIMNDELERRVERRTLALQESQKMYLHAEKLTAIGKLSATIAHEFGNPLLGIQYFLKDLKSKDLLKGEDRQYLEIAIEESRRMKDLIVALRDYSRTSPGVKAHVDLHRSLDSLLLLLKIDFNKKNIQLIRKFANELPIISAVPDQIKQVFLNILTNAADACSQTGAMITVSTRQKGSKVAVAIEDNGCGIKPEQMAFIFQPFFTTKPEVEGTGLGLSVCYGIIKQHGGEIIVQSSPGQGSTFTVLLPIIGGDDAADVH